MISARIVVSSAVEGKPLDIPVEGEESVVGSDHRAVGRQKREANNVAAAECHFGFRLGSDAHDAPPAAQRARDVEIAEAVERETLRTSQPAEEYGDLARGRNSVHAVVARSGWPRDEQF